MWAATTIRSSFRRGAPKRRLRIAARPGGLRNAWLARIAVERETAQGIHCDLAGARAPPER